MVGAEHCDHAYKLLPRRPNKIPGQRLQTVCTSDAVDLLTALSVFLSTFLCPIYSF